MAFVEERAAAAVATGIPEGIDGRIRPVIEDLSPAVDGGRYPVKRILGDRLVVTATIFADGHDLLSCALLHRLDGDRSWLSVPMESLGSDRWRGAFVVDRLGRWRFTVMAWIDRFASLCRDVRKKIAAGQDVAAEIAAGAVLLAEAAGRADRSDAESLHEWGERLGRSSPTDGAMLLLSEAVAFVMGRLPDRRLAARHAGDLPVDVDRERARSGAWYEMFPRSAAAEAGRHGTFRDVEARLPYVASMGFDVLYFPPIHPIGRTSRKGRNNALAAGPEDVGSPWAIGSAEGGHDAIHPRLGTLEDFRRLLRRAGEHGLEVALDLAFQCSPDHPWVREHPEWFRRRRDGTIAFAENPPKRYEDIVPFDFEGEGWRGLWAELRRIVLFWADQGIRIFRVDNPHTKPFRFWEWLIAGVKAVHPEALFLAEAFTRPSVMLHLAKVGFTQSYTYFAWRNTKGELLRYFEELAGPVREYFRPNLWPNTPDILTEPLQAEGRRLFAVRLVLAATLGASYGIYGPAYELAENRPLEPGREEYLDSEKYEIRRWDLGRPDSLKGLIGRVNRIRRENPALLSMGDLRFHPVSNDRLIAYSKRTGDLSNIVLTVVNLDPHHIQSGWLELPVEAMGIDAGSPYQVHDLLGDARYVWHGGTNYVELNPHVAPAHIFRLRRLVRSERDFEYYD